MTARRRASREARNLVEQRRRAVALYGEAALSAALGRGIEAALTDCDGCVCGCPCCAHVCGIEEQS